MLVPERNKLLYELKSKGQSVRQLARMTGLNWGVVQKAQGVKRTVPLTLGYSNAWKCYNLLVRWC